MTLTLRRLVELANAGGGRVLQVGARATGHAGTAHRCCARPTARHPPGHRVDLVATLTSGPLPLSAPWTRCSPRGPGAAPGPGFRGQGQPRLEAGWLVDHQAPGAWPAHAEPNDFWRTSAEGLRVLFGPGSGSRPCSRGLRTGGDDPTPNGGRGTSTSYRPGLAMADPRPQSGGDSTRRRGVALGASEGRSRRDPVEGPRGRAHRQDGGESPGSAILPVFNGLCFLLDVCAACSRSRSPLRAARGGRGSRMAPWRSWRGSPGAFPRARAAPGERRAVGARNPAARQAEGNPGLPHQDDHWYLCHPRSLLCCSSTVDPSVGRVYFDLRRKNGQSST